MPKPSTKLETSINQVELLSEHIRESIEHLVAVLNNVRQQEQELTGEPPRLVPLASFLGVPLEI